MPMLRLAYARSQLLRRRPISRVRYKKQKTVATPPVDAKLLSASAERLAAAVAASPCEANARVLAFDSAYLLLAAVATGDALSGLGPRRPELAARGAARLGLPKEHQEVAELLASIYGQPGWETIDLEVTIEWATAVAQAAARTPRW